MDRAGLEGAALVVAALVAAAGAAAADSIRAPAANTRTDIRALGLECQQRCDVLSCLRFLHIASGLTYPRFCSAHSGGGGATNGGYQDAGPAPCALLTGPASPLLPGEMAALLG